MIAQVPIPWLHTWLRLFSATLNYDTRTFVVWDIDLIERYWKFFLCYDIELEPGTEQIIEAKLERGFEHNTNTPGILQE